MPPVSPECAIPGIPHPPHEVWLGTAMEEGRRLASERENLIARGADPTDLAVPLAPLEEEPRPQMLFTAAVLARTVQVPLDIAEYPELVHAHLTAVADALRADIAEKGLVAVGASLLRVSVEQYAEQVTDTEGRP